MESSDTGSTNSSDKSNTGSANSSTVDIGQRVFQYRDYTPIPLIILMFFVATPSVTSATLGTIIIVAGELFRIYSVAFIGSISRTRSSNTGHALVRTGPFGWMRNPLYVANFFIVLGVTVFSGTGWLVLLTVLLFALQYYFVVAYEESVLAGRFGDEFSRYLSEVPQWLPKQAPKLSEIEWPSSFSPAIKSEKRTLTTICVVILGLVLTAA